MSTGTAVAIGMACFSAGVVVGMVASILVEFIDILKDVQAARAAQGGKDDE